MVRNDCTGEIAFSFGASNDANFTGFSQVTLPNFHRLLAGLTSVDVLVDCHCTAVRVRC